MSSETWVPKVGEWVRHAGGGIVEPGTVAKVVRYDAGYVDVVLLDGTAQVWCRLDLMAPCLPPSEPVTHEVAAPPALPTVGTRVRQTQMGWTGVVVPRLGRQAFRVEWDEAAYSAWMQSRPRLECVCPRCGGDTYAGLLGREHVCPPKEPAKPARVIEVMVRGERVWQVEGQGIRHEHPIRQTAIAMWRAEVER